MSTDFPLLDYIDQGIQSRNATYSVVAPSHSARRQEMLMAIVASGIAGVTLDELSQRFGVSPNAISGRLTELKRSGLIRHTDQRRKTRSGHSAAVLIAVAPLARGKT